jgi:hypothetical protein
MDGITPPNPARVLRAADVIPPFESNDASSDNRTDENDVPTFDLAESILAEQRRLATGKRKRARSAVGKGMGERANGRTGDTSPASSVAVSPIQPFDLTELHRIVAGIVSRDIERLCTGPSVAL